MPDATTPPDALAALLWQRYRDGTMPDILSSPVIEALLTHRSVRAYLPDALPPGTIETAVAAAQSAASSSNLQLWSVVAVEDPARKARLAAVANNQKHIETAPLLLVWLADLSRLGRLAERRGIEAKGLDFIELLIVGIADAAIAAQNAVVALESLGLGTVYIGALRGNMPVVAQELALPPHVMPLFGLVVGKPNPARPAAIKPRLPLRSVLSREQYSAVDDEAAIAGYDAVLAEFQREQGQAVEGWTPKSLERVRTPEVLHGRHHLHAALQALGFPLK